MEHNNIEIEIISEYERFAGLQPVWNDLLAKSASDHVCMTFEWFRAWWDAFGANNRLFVLLMREGGRLIGIAPLMRERTLHRGIPVQRIGFMANDHSPCCDFIMEHTRVEALNAVIAYLQHQSGWDMLALENVPRSSPTHEVLRAGMADGGMRYGVQPGLRSPYIEITTEWDRYFATRSKKFRKVVKNKINRINRCGEYAVSLYNGGADVRGIIERITEISRNSWKQRQRNALGSSPETLQFFTSLSHEAERNKWIRIWVLTINGKDAAYEYHLQRDGRVYALRADYDERYRDSSPGSVLDLHIVKRLFEDGCGEYDLCGSNNFYKMNWTSTVHDHSRFLAFNRGPFGRMLYFLEFGVVASLRKNGLLRRVKDTLAAAGGNRSLKREVPPQDADEERVFL
jgi:CelD/BcsL family acetyltransferase involved in cellulose biosynthesis